MSQTFYIPLEESLRFAALSGDFNPLHVDPVRARRLPFGGCVVHGVSIVMRALDVAVGRHGGGPLAALNVQFDAPVMTGQPFEIESERLGSEIKIEIRVNALTAQRISARLADAPLSGPEVVSAGTRSESRDLDFAAAAEAHGSLPFAWTKEEGAALYPRLAAATPAWQCAALAATTCIVGMECPGLHSIYTRLNASFQNGPRDDEIEWRVVRADKRFRLLRIEARAACFSAHIDALMRAAPVTQPSFAEVCAAAPARRFAQKRVLVVGGGRGLGEVAAKIYAAGGADVVLTYSVGGADAERVADEIRAGGANACACALDVLAPAPPATLPLRWRPTDLAYFASPQITLSPGAPWNPALFERFCRYFVGGFAATVALCDDLLGARGQPLHVFYPSSIYVETLPPGSAEYAASKRAGEAYCDFLRLRRANTTISAPRLPRMLTDQTSSIRSGPMDQPLAILLQHLA